MNEAKRKIRDELSGLLRAFGTDSSETLRRYGEAEARSLHDAIYELEVFADRAVPNFTTGDSSVSLAPSLLAGHSLEIAAKKGTDEALRWLSRVTEEKCVGASEIALLSGVICPAVVSGENQTCFYPVSQFGLRPDEKRVVDAAIQRADTQALCFLSCDHELNPAVGMPTNHGGIMYLPAPQSSAQTKLRLSRYALSTTVIGPSSTRIETSWTRVTDPDFALLATGSYSLTDGRAPLGHGQSGVITLSSIENCSNFDKMIEPEQMRLADALGHLQSAMACSYLGDQAVRLVTLLESTFCNADERNGRRGLVKRRVQGLIGTVDTTNIDTTYDARNQIVHSGRANLNEADMLAISDTSQFCARVLREIAVRGRFER